MTKKNFKGGLNSLLGDGPTKSENKIKLRGYETHLKEKDRQEAIDALLKKPKRGRPVTQTKEITKSSQEGTKENETRATFIVNEDLLDKVKAIAYWERELIKDTINRALQETVNSYIKKNKVLKAIPKK